MSLPDNGKQSLLDAIKLLQRACDASDLSADERALVNELKPNLDKWFQRGWPVQLVTWISGIYMDLAGVLLRAKREARELDLLMLLAALHK